MRAAERHAGCRNKRFSRRARSASGVTSCVSGGKRAFRPGSGERPADSFWQQLDGATRHMGKVTVSGSARRHHNRTSSAERVIVIVQSAEQGRDSTNSELIVRGMEKPTMHKADRVMQRTESAATEGEDQAGPTPAAAEQNARCEQRVHSIPDKAGAVGKAPVRRACHSRQ